MKVLDSDILIAITKNNKDALKKFEELREDEEICITVFNEHEVLYGALSSNKYFNNCKGLLDSFCKLPYNSFCVMATLSLIKYLEKNGVKIGKLDEMIAGICIANNATIITRNIEHFSRVPNLKIEKW